MDNMYVNKLIEGIIEGKIVLPDFQRDFVWDSDRVRELIVSVLGDYFIGSMLMLDDFRQDDCPFALRLIYGVKDINKFAEIKPVVHVILDGQQRATALLYALTQPKLKLKNRKNPYKFYINIPNALNGKWDDAVIAINTANKKELDKIDSSPDNIQLTDFADPQKLYKKIKDDNPNFRSISQLSDQFRTRPINVISLSKGTSIHRIAETFERANRFSVPLTTFELLTARLRKDGIKLPELWSEARNKYDFAKGGNIDPEVILRVISLLKGSGTKRGDLLDLKSDIFKEDWAQSCKWLNFAYKRLTNVKQGYGVLTFHKWLPYTTMLVPLAAILGFLNYNKFDNPNNYSKIDRWYWTSVFSNRYDEGASSKQETDYDDLKEWIKKDDEIPEFIKDFVPNRDVNFTVEKQNSATYRGIINLIVLKGAFDFQNGQPPILDEEHVQDDHIFPKSIYSEHRILNRTLLTTNAKKSNTPPSIYFKQKLQQYGEFKLKEILASHIIPKEALPFLLTDSIQGFLKERRKAIIKEIKQKVKSIS
ncbi:MAG TPA: DUF262 domain-containing protein [Dehalococcoidales bacterium]